MLLYYITDRHGFGGTEAQQRSALLKRIGLASSLNVDYIQLREKDLSARELEALAREAIRIVRENSATTKLLINQRTDIALAVGADGVHLPSGELAASEVRALWMRGCGSEPCIGVSAHSVGDVRSAEAHGANFAVLAPIFEKAQTSSPGVGLPALKAACAGLVAPDKTESVSRSSFSVLALGGVTLDNAHPCVRAGAAGVAGIRLFQQGEIRATIRRLREMPIHD